MNKPNSDNRKTPPTSTLTIAGIVERIVYVNDENMYTVAVIQEDNQTDSTTVVGNFSSICPGETMQLHGNWITNKKYGRQFRVDHYNSIIPSSVNAIKLYLGSGLIKGIGGKFAERIVDCFGTNTLNVIDNDVNRLAIVDGMGRKRIACVKHAWAEQKEIREIMIFLQGCGVGSINAVKIYKQYGDQSISILKQNPYKLAMDITGIGFKTADSVAQKMGIPFNSKVRVEAGILFILHEFAGDGHVFCPHGELIDRGTRVLGVAADDITNAIESLRKTDYVVVEREEGDPVYLKGFWFAETGVAKRLAQIVHFHGQLPSIIIEKAIEWVMSHLSIDLSEKQRMSIRAVIENPVTVITGGPGVGKTTTINSIIKILNAKSLRILLAAPTGRAAKRLSETSGKNAVTIHRLLKFSPKNRVFEFNEKNMLSADVFMIDEVSMIDINLMCHLLKAIPPRARLILVGDIDQLPSVGPGNVLRDIINSGIVKTIRLTEIFRQAEESLIVKTAHMINNGAFPPFLSKTSGQNIGAERDDGQETGDRASTARSADRSPLYDFYFVEREEPSDVADTLKRLYLHDIPRRFGLDRSRDIQVLTPMHKGDVGASALNSQLQEAINHDQKYVMGYARKFCVRDKVMQIRNNYDKDVFNGDIGRVTEIDKTNGYVVVEFDGRGVKYDTSDLDELTLSYAITIHKSQGNEYPAVVIPISTQHYIMLQRNLIYTAITRGKRLVVVIGSKKAFRIAISNNKIAARYTMLDKRLEIAG